MTRSAAREDVTDTRLTTLARAEDHLRDTGAGLRAGASQPTRSASGGRRLGAMVTGLLASLLLGLAVVVLLLMTVAPRALHYRTATMLTASMVPSIRPGDIVVDTLEPVTAIRVGQVITYQIPINDHRVESHRVVWVGRDAAGMVLVRTRGDANSGADPWTARMDQATVWRVREVVPLVGTAIRWLRQPTPSLILSRILPAVLVGWLLVSIWTPARTAGPAGAEDADADNAAGSEGVGRAGVGRGGVAGRDLP